MSSETCSSCLAPTPKAGSDDHKKYGILGSITKVLGSSKENKNFSYTPSDYAKNFDGCCLDNAFLVFAVLFAKFALYSPCEN